MKPISLANISYAQGIKLLQLRKQALDAGHVSRLSAAALANSSPMTASALRFKVAADSWLDTAKQYLNSGVTGVSDALKDAPTREAIMFGLGGAGLGAAGSGGLAAMRGDADWKQRAIQGALAGGVLGGGLGLIKNPSVVTRYVEPTLQSAADSAITPAEAAPAQAEKQNLTQLKDNANTSLTTGAVAPIAASAGAGGALGAGVNYGLRSLPGADIDRKYIAQELLARFQTDQRTRDALLRDHPAVANRINSAGMAGGPNIPPVQLDDLTTQLARELPAANLNSVAGLQSYISDVNDAERLANQSRHFGLSSRAAQAPTWAGWRSNLRGHSLARLGVGTGFPMIGAGLGVVSAIDDVRKILAARKLLRDLTGSAGSNSTQKQTPPLDLTAPTGFSS